MVAMQKWGPWCKDGRELCIWYGDERHHLIGSELEFILHQT